MAVFYMNSVKPNGQDASVLSEDDKFSHNGVDPFMDIAKDGSFSDDAIEEAVNLFTSLTLNEDATLDESYDPAMIMSAIDAAGNWAMGGGMISVGGESVPANLAKIIMGVVPATAVSAAIKHMWPEIKSWMMDKNESGPPAIKQEPDEPRARIAPAGPPAIKQEPDKPRARIAPAGPPAIKQEPDKPRARIAPAGPPAIKQEPDKPRARIAPKQNPS